MACFRGMKYAVNLTTQFVLSSELAANVARNGLRSTAAAVPRPTGQLFSALSMSSVSHSGSSSDDEGAKASNREKTVDEVLFVDSSQEDISGARWQDWEDEDDGNWRDQLTWLSNMVEPALSMYKGPSQPDILAEKWDGSASGRSLVDIVTGLLKSTAGMQQWSLGDITFGLYLLSLRHTAERSVDAVQGEKVSSDFMVEEWIYYLELAWGAYMKDAAMLARISMLKEENVVKFVNRASIMRPAYFVAVDPRHKLVILSIRGTQTIHDVITDLSSDSDHAEKVDGEPVHYGSVEAARWFLHFEVQTLRRYVTENEGFSLLLTGHSLGGATAALVGLLLRKDSQKLLGLCPDKIRVVGIGTPPCVSKVLASRCRAFTSTLVLQDDVIPRVSMSALIRLRNEILCTDWNDVLKEGVERKGFVDLVAGTMQALTSFQEAARKYKELARRTINLNGSGNNDASGDLERQKHELAKTVKPPKDLPDLVAPGALYHICTRQINTPELIRNLDGSSLSMWKGVEGSYFGRIVVSSNMFSDHRIESYYYSLRGVLKELPSTRKSFL
ncbi:unnamed protein product [Calypogeia fissa]